ncbi:phosphoglycolate phosphatase [Marivivens donghaensis]|uniref:phosphoglycolate phosphatase n=1 Tax=Marivivens donghaensis TaxID=1699413 RepID=UPI00201F15C1|nr:phosphoglycolate phosphatase [Marivivens donghaensis]MCL7408914.1 phosphoglycolate phosphatase [Marivivens donghaensis]MDN3703788.1 phosphoglycolate phosphatase [Marivivens donghaensis]
MPHNTALVFDLDGTLIDSLPAISGSVNAMLADMGCAPLPVTQIRGFIGKGAPNLVKQSIAAAGLPEDDSDTALSTMMRHYEAAHDGNIPFDHMVGTLEGLRAAGFGLGICTNKPSAATQAVLDHLGLTDLFDVVISGDSLPQRKPHPAPLYAAFDALSCANRIYIGDSEVDAETATAAEVPFVLFTEGYRKAPISDLTHAATFDDFRALPEIIASLQ